MGTGRTIATGLLAAALALAGAASAPAQLPGLPAPAPTPTPGPPSGAPPVADPGPLLEATTHELADPARRGAIAGGGLRPPLRSLWRQDFGSLVAAAVVGDGRAYVVAEQRVIALDLATGRRLWTSAAPIGGAGLAFGGGKVVALAEGRRNLVAFDAATGAVAWSAEWRGYGGSPLIAGELVIVQHQGLSAYDLATGARRWEGGDDDGVDGDPAAAGDRIFQFGGCTAAAVDRRDGAVLWSRNSGCSGGTSGSVALTGDRVHSSFGAVPLAAADGTDRAGPKAQILAGDVGLQRTTAGIDAVSLSGGRLLWSARGDTSVPNDALGAPLVMGDWLYQTRFEGLLEARALGTGAVGWRARLRPAKSTFTGSTSDRGVRTAGGNGILLVLRGSTVDAVGSAGAPPAALAIDRPRGGAALAQAGAPVVVAGRATGDLWPERAVLQVDRHPFGSFRRAKGSARVGADGKVALRLKTDRNALVRLAGAGGSARPTRAYALLAYPRIRLRFRNAANLVTTRIRVRGSRAIRYRGRAVHLYLARVGQRRMHRLASTRLAGPKRGAGRATARFPAIRRAGRRDFVFACVPKVHRLGQGAGDRVQRRCGRATIRY